MDEGIWVRTKRRAVTLVELLVVVAVIGLLMAMPTAGAQLGA